jgi:5-dehydro-2-deoxygluconokinase
VLGRHAGHEKLDHCLRVAAPVPGYSGFAMGQSIWWDARHDHRHRYTTSHGARDRIAGAYVDFANYYIKAREGLFWFTPWSPVRRKADLSFFWLGT